MIDPKKMDQSILTSLDDLLTLAFQVPQELGRDALRRSFYDDFPVWRPGASSECRIWVTLDPQGGVAATAGVRLAHLRREGGQVISIALIGAVATRPSERGRGLANDLIHAGVDFAKSQKVDAVVLWDSSESGLYQRLGFKPLSGEYLMRLEPFVSEGTLPPRAQYQTGWDDSIYRLLQGRSSGIRLEHKDLDWYRRHKNTQWHWIKQGKDCLACCAIGRGIDLNGIVHEWHGDMKLLSILFSAVNKRAPGALLMGPRAPSGTIEYQKNIQGMILPLVPSLEWSDWWFWGLDAC